MAETIACRDCGQETLKRTYATKRCPMCDEAFYRPRPVKIPATTTQRVDAPHEVVPVPQAVAAAPKETPYKSLTEARYAEHLERLRLAGEITAWRYEPIRFRLADRTTYTSDFQVILPSGAIEFHETKLTWKDRRNAASRVKLKLVAEIYKEFRFAAMLPSDGGTTWEREDIGT
jgi:hypothetical protein